MKLVGSRTISLAVAATMAGLGAPVAADGQRAHAVAPPYSGAPWTLTALPVSIQSNWGPSKPTRSDTLGPSFDLRIASRIRGSGIQENPTARVIAGTFRLASVPGTVLVAASLFAAGGIADRGELRDLGLHSAQAIALAGSATMGGKLLLGRARPRVSPNDAWDVQLGRGMTGDGYQSFPSAHTAAAFATATVLASELADRHPQSAAWIYPSLYASATMAGLSRLLDEAHWATDVLGGALLGILGGAAVLEYHR